MKKWMTLVALLVATPAFTQISNVNPRPQQIVTSSALFDAPKQWQLKTDATLAKEAFINAVGATTIHPKAPFKLTITVNARKAPKHSEGYTLKITRTGAEIIGADDRGAFYGVQTLLGIMREGKLQECTINDYPDVPFRGVVEGFYGTPWSHKARLSQLAFYGRNKMNVYIYGPKDDPYHRTPYWRKPYPPTEAAQLKELVEAAHRAGVNFYWAVHPGGDIRWTTEDRDSLMMKLESMYELGVRSFAVFFDDIWGEGAKAEKQAELLNYVHERFVKIKGDVSPLILCPTVYNKAWSGDGSYLHGLRDRLNKEIMVMWTGNTVVHDLDKPSLEWVNKEIGRPAYIWWNFAVSDYVRDRLLLGPAYGNGLDIAPLLSGFVSNPMEHAEASKISLYGVADYTWNMKAYDSDADWRRAIADLLPTNAKALETFASYNEDPGNNGHGYRRDESRTLQPIAARATAGDAAAVAELAAKCKELGQAADLLLNDTQNPGLLKELYPWLLQAKLVAQYGQVVCTMQTADDIHQARSLQKQMYDLGCSAVRHPLQPGIKVGTKVLMPALNRLFAQNVENYNRAHGTNFDPIAEYQAYTLMSDVPQLKSLSVRTEGSNVVIGNVLEVVTWPAGAGFTITCDRTKTLRGLEFDFGKGGIEGDFKLEIEHNGHWTEVGLLQNNPKGTTINTVNKLNGMRCDKVRLTNKSGRELQYKFNTFLFVVE